jgi:hypothetical protein
MMRAQAGLEYLIIIAAVIGIAAVVVYTISGVMSSQSSSASIATCKQASVDCKASRMLSPNDPCSSCYRGCTNPATGKDVIQGAVTCCNHTETNKIYADSDECSLTVQLQSPTGTYVPSSFTVTLITSRATDCQYKGSTGSFTPMSSTGGTTHTQPLSGFADGQNLQYTFRCYDKSPLYYTGEISKAWIVDSVAPSVSLTDPGSRTVVENVWVRAVASDLNSGLQSVSLQIASSAYPTSFREFYNRPASTCVQQAHCSTSPCTYTWNSSKYDDGDYILRAVATDNAGNTFISNTNSVTVDNTIIPAPFGCPNNPCTFGCCHCSDGYHYCSSWTGSC